MPSAEELEAHKEEIAHLPTDTTELQKIHGTLEAELAHYTEVLRIELEKRQKWHNENIRRKHNYLSFIFELLKLLAAKGKLPGLVAKAKEEHKKKKAEKAQKAEQEAKMKAAQSVSEAKQSEAKQPEAKQQEAKQPEAKQQEAKQPEAKQPEAKQPEAKQPEAKQSEAKQPEAKQPEAKQGEVKQDKPAADPSQKEEKH